MGNVNKSREDIKNDLLMRIDEYIDKNNEGITAKWVDIFNKFLSALDIESSTKEKE